MPVPEHEAGLRSLIDLERCELFSSAPTSHLSSSFQREQTLCLRPYVS